MQEKLRRFMAGRYGPDELSRDILWVSFGILILGMVFRQSWTAMLALLVTSYSWFRIFSRNFVARSAERTRYLSYRQRILSPLRKLRARRHTARTHRIFACPQCKKKVKVPKGKGKINITCPQCGQQFIKRT